MARIKMHLSVLIPCTYVECGICVEPSEEEIRQAVEKGELEQRGMDEHQAEIKSSLLAGSNNGSDVAAVVRMMKDYHTKRVAYFVVNGLSEGDPHPITVNGQNHVVAGNHRVRAARYLKMDEVEVEVAG
jgi:hypothetical protein